MISWVLLTWNCESEVENALLSAKDVVDEIIVVDSFSTDRTLEIVKKYGARIFEKPFENSFGALRNFGIEQARGDWILILDSDEELSSVAKKAIPLMVSEPDFDCFVFKRDNYLDDVLQQGEDSHYRLFRKYCRYEGRMHEQLVGYNRRFSATAVSVIHKKSRKKQDEQTARYLKIEAELKLDMQRGRIAVVGYGYQGRKHAEELQNLGLDVVTCDKNGKAQLIDYKEITGVKGVVIATPNSTHFEIAKWFLNQGVPILLEKPIAMNAAQATELLGIAVAGKIPFLSGSVFSFNHGLKVARDIIAAGEIGKVEFFKCSWKMRMKPWSERDILFDLGPHAYDIARYFSIVPGNAVVVEADPEHVCVFANTPEIRVEFDLSWLEGPKERNVKIMGSYGFLNIDALSQKIQKFTGYREIAKMKGRGMTEATVDLQPNNAIQAMLLEFVRQIDRGPDYMLVGQAIDFLTWEANAHYIKLRKDRNAE